MKTRAESALVAVRLAFQSGVGVAAWVVGVLALAIRLPFGAGTTDEAFYSAMSYGFVLGNKPYQDELALHQNAAILTVPFFRLYTWLCGTEGILLFNRWLYLAYITLCSAVTFRLVRKLTDTATAGWAAAMVVSFSYFNLFTISYNTLAALGALMGALLASHALIERPVRHLVGASLFYTSATFAYPTFGLIAILHPLLVLARLRRDPGAFKRSALAAGICAIVALLLAGVFFASVTGSVARSSFRRPWATRPKPCRWESTGRTRDCGRSALSCSSIQCCCSHFRSRCVAFREPHPHSRSSFQLSGY